MRLRSFAASRALDDSGPRPAGAPRANEMNVPAPFTDMELRVLRQSLDILGPEALMEYLQPMTPRQRAQLGLR